LGSNVKPESMEQIGVVFEMMIDEKRYAYDTFQFDLDRMVKTIEETKRIVNSIEPSERKYVGDKLTERKELIIEQMQDRVSETHTEAHRTIIINYLACTESVLKAVKDNPNESMGITLRVKLEEREIVVLKWSDFERMLEHLPKEYFEY
jgi:ElaB/YqjD/DUF883 family membrane-anchored ribosome-binding protein